MSSIGIVGSVITFTGTAGNIAIARSSVTTAAPTDLVSFEFTITRRPLVLRVGTSAGGQEVLTDSPFLPGFHIVSFTPGVSPYYVEFRMVGVGTATLDGFARIAPGVMEIETPYLASAIPSVRHAQSLNTVFFAGGGAEMQVLERRGQNSWSFRPWVQYDGPFAPLNLTDTTLTAAARTGTTTLTASTELFATTDVGALIRLTHDGQFETEDFSAVDNLTDAIRVSGITTSRQFQVSITGTFTGTILLERSIGNEYSFGTFASYTSATAVTIDDDLDNQIIYYRLRMSAYSSGTATVELTYGSGVTDGVARVITVDADNQVTVDVIEPFAKTTATTLWNFGEWSVRYGYPAAVALFDGRLWTARGNYYWGSASDDFGSFAIGPLADQAIGRTFGGRMSSTRWLAGASRLVAGLSGFEAEISSNALDDVLMPENVKSRGVKTRGSLDADPAVIDDAAVFINRTAKRMYWFGPADGSSSFSTIDLTRLHRQISGAGGFVSIAYQTEPEPRVWAVRADGECGCLVFDLDESVVAWCRLKVDGFVESVCCMPGGDEDEVYFVIKRTVDGGTVRYIEQLANQEWDTVSEANRLHASAVYDGAETSVISSGLSHLEGREDVYVWGNGRISGPYTVASGGIAALDYAVTYAIIGLKYDGLYKGPRLNWGAQMGSSLATNKQLEDASVVVHETAGGCLEVGYDDFTDMEILPDRDDDGTLTYDSPVQVFTEDREFKVMGETSRDTRLTIRMSGAGPATVLGIAPKMKVNG